jgi:hypothetical protein
MMPRLTRTAGLALLASAALAGAGCHSAGASGAAAPVQTVSPVGAVAPQPLRLAGLLTLKGSEMDAWWALADDGGTVWRLEPADGGKGDAWRGWQNRRVRVEGTPLPKFLNTPRLRVERLEPAP